jgi:hypothetical protein
MQPENFFEDFKRDISYRIFKVEQEIALTATLQDMFHDIFVEIRVNPENLMIISARADFLKHPSDFCAQIDKAMTELVGEVISKGINRRLIEIFGGSEGCGNIKTLLMGLLPLALNAKAAEGVKDKNQLLDNIRKELTGTCIGYPANY